MKIWMNKQISLKEIELDLKYLSERIRTKKSYKKLIRIAVWINVIVEMLYGKEVSDNFTTTTINHIKSYFFEQFKEEMSLKFIFGKRSERE